MNSRKRNGKAQGYYEYPRAQKKAPHSKRQDYFLMKMQWAKGEDVAFIAVPLSKPSGVVGIWR